VWFIGDEFVGGVDPSKTFDDIELGAGPIHNDDDGSDAVEHDRLERHGFGSDGDRDAPGGGVHDIHRGAHHDNVAASFGLGARPDIRGPARNPCRLHR
jgi:hypothetical protein